MCGKPTILSFSQHGETITFVIPDSCLDLERTGLLFRQMIAVAGFSPGALEDEIAINWMNLEGADLPSLPTPSVNVTAFPYLAKAMFHGEDNAHFIRFSEKVPVDMKLDLEKFFGREIKSFEWVAVFDNQIKEA